MHPCRFINGSGSIVYIGYQPIRNFWSVDQSSCFHPPLYGLFGSSYILTILRQNIQPDTDTSWVSAVQHKQPNTISNIHTQNETAIKELITRNRASCITYNAAVAAVLQKLRLYLRFGSRSLHLWYPPTAVWVLGWTYDQAPMFLCSSCTQHNWALQYSSDT